MSAETKEKPVLSEGILLAAIPAFGYGLAFLYERSYCDYFGIPSSFISLSISHVLAVTVGLFWAFFFLAHSGYFLAHLIGPKRLFGTAIGRSLFKLAITAFALLLLKALYSDGVSFLFISGMMVFLLFFEIGIPVIFQRRVRCLNNKIEAQY